MLEVIRFLYWQKWYFQGVYYAFAKGVYYAFAEEPASIRTPLLNSVSELAKASSR